MTALSDEKHIRSALRYLADKRLPDDFPFGGIKIKRQWNQTVSVIVEMTFRIRPDEVNQFTDIAEELSFDGTITFERGKNPVLVRVETPLHKSEVQKLSECIWQ